MGDASYSQSFKRVVDRLRLMIFDRKPPSWPATREYQYLFTDGELSQVYAENGSCIWKTAACCIRILAAQAARQAIDFTLLKESVRVNRTLTPTYLLKVADHYDKQAQSQVATEIDQWTDGDDDFIATIANLDEYDMEAD